MIAKTPSGRAEQYVCPSSPPPPGEWSTLSVLHITIQVLAIARDVASGMSYLHPDIIYCDLKVDTANRLNAMACIILMCMVDFQTFTHNSNLFIRSGTSKDQCVIMCNVLQSLPILIFRIVSPHV